MEDDPEKQLEALEQKIKKLEDAKSELIDRIRYLTRRMRLKKYEQKALGPFLEQTKDVRILPLRKKRNRMEFMIATAAYTPRMEKEWLKEVRRLDKELEKVKEIERARRKKHYVDNDIKEGEIEIEKIEKSLKESRESLRQLYDEAKSVRMTMKRSAMAAALAEEEMVSLEDLAMIDRKGKK